MHRNRVPERMEGQDRRGRSDGAGRMAGAGQACLAAVLIGMAGAVMAQVPQAGSALPAVRFPGDPPDVGRDPGGADGRAPAAAVHGDDGAGADARARGGAQGRPGPRDVQPALPVLGGPSGGAAAVAGDAPRMAWRPLPSGPGCGPAAAGQTGFRIDNDLVSGQDYGYSAGLMLEVAARTRLADAGTVAAASEGWVCPFWRWLGGGEHPTEQVAVQLDTAMYTPVRSAATWLVTDDRPYAATLMLGFSGTRRQGAQHVRNVLRLGWVGPSLRGESIQNSLHRVIHAPRFRGWAHQLRDEPLLELAQYRSHRWQPAGRDTDLLGHWGVRLGNLQTSAFAGLEWRWGRGLQDDGGSAPVRPGSNEAAETNWHGPGASRWVWFVTAGVRAVAWDLSLDGNVRHDSHSVRRKPLVVDGGAGLAVQEGAWTARFMWVLRSHEFDGQKHLPSYGALLVSYVY